MSSAKFIGVAICLTFATLGAVVINMANNHGKTVPGVDLSQPRHPVTPQMAAEVKKLNQRVAKLFTLPNSEGKPTTIGGAGKKPQFIYSVKKGCPCSFDAEPLMQALYKHHNGKIEFAAVTDANQQDAHQWELDLKVPYPVISNPKLEVFNEYEYPASVYCSLVNIDGVIVKRWAGYSKSYLAEMNSEMAKLLNESARPFNAQYAPVAQTSGCSYDEYKGPDASKS